MWSPSALRSHARCLLQTQTPYRATAARLPHSAGGALRSLHVLPRFTASQQTLTASRSMLITGTAARASSVRSPLPLHVHGRGFSSSQEVEEVEQEDNRDRNDGDRGIAMWLFGCSGLVFGMVILGGLTRLTKSGLSMVEWKPQGSRAPSTDEEWEVEFAKYKEYPEYKKLNQGMTLSEFKFIYMMEWSHRMLGRCIGIAFGVPLLYFAARGRLHNKALQKRLGMLFAMGGAQGMVGWWMVRSGLKEQERATIEPKVSPYRLATHLISAFAIYSLLFTTGLQQWSPASQRTARFIVPKGLLNSVRGTVVLVGLTAFSGAFVAGNRAGLVYNEFPLMGGRWIPEDIEDPYLSPKWRNMFENSSLVQFNHRVLGMSTVTVCSLVFAYCRRCKISPSSMLASRALLGVAGLQVTLGISTLLLYVPVHLAATHQAGSLTLLSVSLWLLHTLTGNPVMVVASTASAAAATVAAAGLFAPELDALFLSEQLSLSDLRECTCARGHDEECECECADHDEL